MGVYTPTPTNETNAVEFDDGDAPSAANINPLAEAAFNTAKYAANRVGAVRVVDIDTTAIDTLLSILQTTTSATWAADTLIGTVDVLDGDTVEIDVRFHGSAAGACSGDYRLAYSIDGGAVTPVPGARARRVAAPTAFEPFGLHGFITLGATPGTMTIYIQMQVTAGVELRLASPLAASATVWRSNA